MANYYLSHTAAELDEAVRKVLSGELDVPLQEKTVTPTLEEQIITPDSEYKGLSQVTIGAVPQSYLDDAWDIGYDEGYETGNRVGYATGYEVGYNTEKPYFQLEYIQSSGTQYIDTGFTPNQDTRVVMEIESVATHDDVPLFGARIAYKNTAFSMWLNTTGMQTDYNNEATTMTLSTSTQFTIDKNKNVTTANGVTVTQTAATFQSEYTAYLFGLNQSGSLNTSGTASIKLYSCQIYDNGTLVRDYIPVLDSDGVACLYDKVTETFYYNAGTGNFLKPGEGSVGITPLITNDESITPTGTYATSAYYNTDYGVKVGYMRNGDILVSMQAGTTTAYETLYFTLASAPSGVTITATYNSSSSYVTGAPKLIYACVISGLTTNATMSIAMDSMSSSYDRTGCAITITAT